MTSSKKKSLLISSWNPPSYNMNRKKSLTFTEIFERCHSADTVLQSRWQKSVCLEAIYPQASYFHGAFHFTVWYLPILRFPCMEVNILFTKMEFVLQSYLFQPVGRAQLNTSKQLTAERKLPLITNSVAIM